VTLDVGGDELVNGAAKGLGRGSRRSWPTTADALGGEVFDGVAVPLLGRSLREGEGETAEPRIGAGSEPTAHPTGELVVALTVESSLRGTHHLPTVRGNLLASRGHFGEARLPFQGDGLGEWVGDGFVASGTGNADDKKAISSLGSY